jgi:hypothetical protein
MSYDEYIDQIGTDARIRWLKYNRTDKAKIVQVTDEELELLIEYNEMAKLNRVRSCS